MVNLNSVTEVKYPPAKKPLVNLDGLRAKETDAIRNLEKLGIGVTAELSSKTFDKIIAKEIPSDIVYEDENVLAFRNIGSGSWVIPKLRDDLTTLGKVKRFGVGVTVGSSITPHIINYSEY